MPDDPRLQKGLTIEMRDAKVPDILQKVRDATGVAFTLENVDTAAVLYRGVNWANTSAWQILRQIAESPKVQGSWEKDADGYRLRGTQPIPVRRETPMPVVRPDFPAPPTRSEIAIPVQPAASEPAPTPAAPGQYVVLLLVGGLVATLIACMALAVVLRLRRHDDRGP